MVRFHKKGIHMSLFKEAMISFEPKYPQVVDIPGFHEKNMKLKVQ